MTTQLPSPAPLMARPQSPMPLPTPRGPLSDALLRVLTGAADPAVLHDEVADVLAAPTGSWLEHDDVQLALTCMYELHYRGLDGVDDDWEWQPDVLAARAALERAVEAELRERVTVDVPVDTSAAAVARTLFTLTSSDDGPSMSRWIARRAQREQLEEFVVHRSVYQLKEADPHTWSVPRLGGAPKVALMEIQSDEYGAGDPERAHAALFAQAMRGLDLDDTYGRYVDHVPAITLAHPNVMSMFGLHRRLRGAIVGHLAAFEMTSSVPNRLYGNGMRRLGLGQDVTEYFDEHVEADAVHEQIAGRDMAGRLVEQEPTLGGDVVWGAAVCLALDGMWARYVLDRWEAGEPSLRQPVR
ncbi:iron-containing redox enzyme family protein [Cellulomonas sp. Sa3CUA2]|uniref:Iron-containing redox enzyme family protein n=1 Tax=Cellulomonas avistercoris TaxID=2762242 RepID=A0ABR8QHM8_9CELL|nr:iron-containing redox enzyme family protein [Cellulomonas avistercoris]MBD7919937.1 iron-containing redox enzyme family protein [Cellulomonas avistercoris]